jgi:hypothetical protein
MTDYCHTVPARRGGRAGTAVALDRVIDPTKVVRTALEHLAAAPSGR